MFRTLFSIIVYPAALTVFGLGAGIYLLAALFIKPQTLHPLARLISRLFLLSCGQVLRVENPPPEPGAESRLYLFNHASLFDVFALVAALPHYVTSVGAEKQFSWPVWGRIVKRYGVIPINRKDLNAAIHSLGRMETVLKSGVSCIISPEGTRTLTGELGPFKKGPFHVARHTGVTLVPVGIIGTFAAKNKLDWRLKPGIITIRFGDPLPAAEYAQSGVEELRNMVRERIIDLIK